MSGMRRTRGGREHRTKMSGMRRTTRRTRTQDKNVRFEEDKEVDEDTGQKCQVGERVKIRKIKPN